MKRTKILIAEDHEIFRRGLVALLKKQAGFEILAEAANGKEICDLARTHEADLIIMDLYLPELNGIEATLSILKDQPEMKILGFSYEKNEEPILEMIRSGAKGYLIKDGALEELLLAIKAIESGGSYFSKGVSLKVLNIQRKRSLENDQALHQKLTKRELEILDFIANEHTNKEIAQKLFISPRTVETHRRNLIQKLKVKNTVGLIKYFLSNQTRIRV